MLNFLGIGAQKCGTTWLYAMLSKHPGIVFPGGKEMHFWNADDYQERLSWYESLFSGDGLVKGEITPAYAILNRERIQKIFKLFPELRLIYLIRNPVDRAWSGALMALHRAEMKLDEASDQWFIDHFHSQGSLQRGDYYQCLKSWYSLYPAHQLLLLRYEDIGLHPRALLHRCCSHLNVSSEPFDYIDNSVLKEKVFAGEGERIRPSLKPVLEKIYTPIIIRLSECVEEDFSDWLK